MTYAPTLVDLSRIAAPEAIESLSHEVLFQGFVTRFKAYWETARAADPTLPSYDVELLEYDPAAIVGQAWSYLRLLDRARVNDAVRAVLAPLAKGADLDNVVARVNVQRLVIAPATLTTPVIMESDESLLRRYLLAFDRPGAGTRDRYIYEAFTAWPLMGDCRVNGWAVHKRRGRVDVVVMAPAGVVLTDERLSVVRAAVLADNVRPEAVDVSVQAARRREYGVKLVAEIPNGPDGELIRRDILARVRAAGLTRTLIAGEIPPGFIAGSAYGPNVLAVRDLVPVAIPPDPYTVPVCADVEVSIEVRQ